MPRASCASEVLTMGDVVLVEKARALHRAIVETAGEVGRWCQDPPLGVNAAACAGFAQQLTKAAASFDGAIDSYERGDVDAGRLVSHVTAATKILKAGGEFAEQAAEGLGWSGLVEGFAVEADRVFRQVGEGAAGIGLGIGIGTVVVIVGSAAGALWWFFGRRRRQE